MATAMMTKHTRLLLSSASSIIRRSSCSSQFLLHSSRRLFCDMHTQEENDSTLSKDGDWAPPRKDYQEKELYDFYVKAVTAVVGSEKEAKERIYLISNDPMGPGFGIYADKKLADKLRDVEGVINLTPDYYEKARDSNPETCLVSM